ncbi:MAG: DNA translocase FtsK [Coprothermobacterota bacterium]|nr:DNA translocase FtsK [Coprothermobacterota bacterium]
MRKPQRNKQRKRNKGKQTAKRKNSTTALWVGMILLCCAAVVVIIVFLPKVVELIWKGLGWNVITVVLFLAIPILLWRFLNGFRARFLAAWVSGFVFAFLLIGRILPATWNSAINQTLGLGIYPILFAFAISAVISLIGRKLFPKRTPIVGLKVKKTKPKETFTAVAEKARIEKKSRPAIPAGAAAEYRLPPLDLLDKSTGEGIRVSRRETRNVQQVLEEKLKSFGIGTRVTNIEIGPAVTRYELELDPGVKVSKIINLSDDIALALAANGGVRIEAPVPGKSVLGIEVPSDKISTVSLREILESKDFTDRKLRVPLAFGKDIAGHPIVADLREMPHLLIAGTTGSGKSVCINSIICGLLYRHTPKDLGLILIDPKRVELYNYRNLPHLLYPVVEDIKQATAVLKVIVEEMENRLAQFSAVGARDIEAFNLKTKEEDGGKRMPYTVVVIDELADLMMIAPADLEKYIQRLAQLARATGIHLIVATQRPSTDVITGVIKANIPSRIAFAVSSQTDSRVILDTGGAEKLLGKGDALFYPVHFPKPKRLQGAFISEAEIDRVVEFWKEQGREVAIRELPTHLGEAGEARGDDFDDPLYQEALRIVLQAGEGSASMLQRKLKIGYARAGRLIDLMERQGILGPVIGSKPRPLLRYPEQSSFKFQ